MTEVTYKGMSHAIPDGKPIVIFATPSLTNTVSLEYKNSIVQTEWALWERQIPHGYIDLGGDQFIDKVRSKLATQFLKDFPFATHLFFLDDDVGWLGYEHKVIEFVERNADIICGVYPKKQETIDWPVELLAEPGTGELIEQDGLLMSGGAGAGFMCIARRVLERLAEDCGTFIEQDASGEWKEYYFLFRKGLGPDGHYWGEDYCFLFNARHVGFQVWVDPDIKFTHRGQKKWTGRLADHLDVFRSKASLAKTALETSNGKADGKTQSWEESRELPASEADGTKDQGPAGREVPSEAA